MKTSTLLLLFCCLLNLTAFAQLKPEQEPPHIEVTGTAEKEIIPDEIYIGITIREKYNNKQKVTIEEQEEKLKSAIKSIGIDLQNLSLSDANANFVKIKYRTKDVITKKEYTLKVTNATAVGRVFQELEKLEILDADIVKVSHSKLDSLRKEVRIMAIKAAKEKADYLLTAIGEQTGKPILVLENVQVPEGFYNTLNNGYVTPTMLNKLESDLEKGIEIEFEKIKIKSSIYVKFLIK
jgi:hypothetical protein